MKIDEIIDKLRQEREFGSRFPARIIFAEDLASYSALVTRLKSACDVTVNLARFSKRDVVPQFNKMREALMQYEGQQVLLLSIGEYLRLCIKRELNKERAQFPSFWEEMQQESSRTRYIMPVFSCRDSFERIIGKVDERQEEFIWTLETLEESVSNAASLNLYSNSSTRDKRQRSVLAFQAAPEQYNISVYSPQFAEVINADASSFEDWLCHWDDILGRGIPCSIITSQYRNVEASSGTISVRPIESPYAYLCELLEDADQIDKCWEKDEFWTKLIPTVKKDMKFSTVVLEQLNVTSFEFISIIARWDALDSFQRELIWMWYRVYPTDEYYSYACEKAQKAAEIPNRIRDEILYLTSRSQNWIEERMKAMHVLKFAAFDDAYFKALDKLPVVTMRLQLLTYKTHEECTFAIKTVSGLLRNGAEQGAVAEMFKDTYPILTAYMSEDTEIDGEIDEYLSWYRKNKLINRFPGNYVKSISYGRFDARFKQLNKLDGKDCFTLWIDGFGIEWLPVFLKELELRGIQPETKNIATAKLPTETEYNHQWDESDPRCEKWSRLDSLSHKGMLDDRSYYSCIVYQLSIFAEVAKRVDELLNDHEYVAITGDHGSSRLAALAFHDPNIVPVLAPPHSKVRSFGRFCELSGDGNDFVELDFMRRVVFDGKTYIIMKDYNRFSVSGNAAGGNSDDQDVVGEIHGGDTPEERLVPVVIVKRSQPLPPLICKPKSRFVTKKNGCIETNLEFNRTVSTLEAAIDSNVGVCIARADGTWDVEFKNIFVDELLISVIADGHLLDDKVSLTVKSQGISQNAGMGGLP